jgi:hypothetical protein
MRSASTWPTVAITAFLATSLEIVTNVCDFLKRQVKCNYKVTLPIYSNEIQKVHKREAEATSVSERKIRIILKK